MLKTLELFLEVEEISLQIPKGSIALNNEGKPLTMIEVQPIDAHMAQPDISKVIGLCFNFLPSGATFNPPIQIILSYDPLLLPENVTAENLVIAFYDDENGTWIELASEVNMINHTVTALADHFTVFAIVATAPMMQSLALETTELTEPVPASQTASATTAPKANPSINWFVISGIIAALVIMAFAIFFMVTRTRSY